ncbi:MAG: prenyltransferase/squalene oxidase repeat-containing protein, partial [Candidatus Bathyarchaeia archaeon]
LQDTYYGLAMLSLLGYNFPDVEKTIKFVDNARVNGIYSAYYVTKASLLLGRSIGSKLKKSVLSILNSNEYFGSTVFYPEISSEFTTTFMALELVNLLKIKVNTEEVTNWLLKFKNDDGGFGTLGQSNVNSTYYAIASINFMKESLNVLSEAIVFVRKCEKLCGGFTVIPLNFSPYMEHTYFGVMTLDMLGERSKYPSETINFVLGCQNDNGGFARSDLGISTFENTFQAVEVLRKLNFPIRPALTDPK